MDGKEKRKKKGEFKGKKSTSEPTLSYSFTARSLKGWTSILLEKGNR